MCRPSTPQPHSRRLSARALELAPYSDPLDHAPGMPNSHSWRTCYTARTTCQGNDVHVTGDSTMNLILTGCTADPGYSFASFV
jgi:hypothetical protein